MYIVTFDFNQNLFTKRGTKKVAIICSSFFEREVCWSEVDGYSAVYNVKRAKSKSVLKNRICFDYSEFEDHSIWEKL